MKIAIISSVATQVQQLFHVKHGRTLRLFESSKGFQSFTRTRIFRAFGNANGNQEQEETACSFKQREKENERCMYVVRTWPEEWIAGRTKRECAL
ncbi:hypothetical protein [Paenarthrobacter sp. 22069]|uniref:hypothetical protein n=1 Tax=Paenarthrobacter sp. 22069 TaxID=3453864 RepID=UPI003F85941A